MGLHVGGGLSIDTFAVEDACADLPKVYKALLNRHGEAFRQLERDTLAACELIVAHGSGCIVPFNLGEGHFVMAPPAPIPDLLRRARALGVL